MPTAGLGSVDFARLFPKLDEQTTMIVAMRSWGHDWKEIAAMLGINPSTARSIFLRSMRAVLPKQPDKKQSKAKKRSKGK